MALAVMTRRGALVLLCASVSAHASCAPRSRLAQHSLARAPARRASVSCAAAASPDPYELVRDDIAQMKTRLRELAKLNAGANPTSVAASQPVLTLAVQEFLQRPGKSFRPMVVLLLGRVALVTAALRLPAASRLPEAAVKANHMRLAELTEMMNVASIIHDDVLDEQRPPSAGAAGGSGGGAGVSGNIVHRTYSTHVGNKVSILAGDFLLARAAVELALLEHPSAVEIMAGALEATVKGGMLRAEAFSMAAFSMAAFEQRTQARFAQLVANSGRCALLLAGFGEGSPEAVAAEAFGLHLGMAHAISAEARAYRQALLAGPEQAAAAAALSRVPSVVALLALAGRPELAEALLRRSGSAEHAAMLAQAVRESGAVDAAQQLALSHATQAEAALLQLADCPERSALARLCSSVLVG